MIGVQRKKQSAGLAKSKLNGHLGASTLNKMLNCPSNLNGFKGLKEKSRYPCDLVDQVYYANCLTTWLTTKFGVASS